MTDRLEDRTQVSICLGLTGNVQGIYNIIRYALVKKSQWKIHKGIHPHNRHVVIGGNGNKGQIFLNRTGPTVNDILSDDKVNELFNEIDGNIIRMYWEAEMHDPAAHTTQLKKISMRHWQGRGEMKTMTPNVHAWRMTAISQECDIRKNYRSG